MKIVNDRVDNLINFSIIVVIGAAILWYDARWFALYALAVTVGLIIFFTGRLWKLIRVSHAATNAKLLVLAKKLGVSDADYDAVLAEARKHDPSSWKAFEQDLKGL